MTGRAWRVHGVWAVVAAAAAASSWWAAATVLRPPAPPAADATAATFTVAQGTVGDSVTSQGEVTFAKGPGGIAASSGTVTSVSVDPGAPIDVGTVVFSVDLRPVTVAQGAVPAFRDLQQGCRGPDVAQLRAFVGVAAGDRFDAATAAAVRAWQGRSGVDKTGVVLRGDLLFLPTLPTRAYVADGISPGSQVNPGDVVIQTVEDRPSIAVPADVGASDLSVGMSARVPVGEATLTGTLADPFTRADGLTAFVIVDGTGAPVCDATCAEQFSLTGTSQVAVQVDLVPPVSGLVVPLTALATRPDGSVALVGEDGTILPVEVTVQGGGMVVVTGVAEGTVVRLFGDGAG